MVSSPCLALSSRGSHARHSLILEEFRNEIKPKQPLLIPVSRPRSPLISRCIDGPSRFPALMRNRLEVLEEAQRLLWQRRVRYRRRVRGDRDRLDQLLLHLRAGSEAGEVAQDLRYAMLR